VGLTKTFSQGIIWCSEAAANLLRDDFGLHNTHVIRSLKLHETVAVTERLRVTALSANHSPDAVMFVFDYDDYDGGTGVTRRTVHTGDFRYTADMLEAAGGLLLKRPVDRLYLDTTYLNPRYVFPSQERVIVELGNWMREQLLAERNTLFAFMSYHIGKERAFFGAAEYLNMKVYVQPKKLRVLRLLNLPERWMRLVVGDPREAKIHVGGRVNEDVVNEDVKKLGFVRGVIVRPTGWSFGKNSRSLVSSRVSAHGVVVASAPYSEHSSYEEIRECVKALRPKRVIPTVNAETSAQRQKLVEKELIGFLDLKEDKRRIDAYFGQGGTAAVVKKKTHAPATTEDGAIDLTASPPPGNEKKPPARSPDVSCNLDEVDVAEQRRLFERLEAENRKRPKTAAANKPPSILHKFFKPLANK